MACDTLTTGRVESCKDSVGGLNNLYFITYGDAPISGIVYNSSNEDVIDTIGSSVQSYKYELKGTSSFEQNIVSSRDNGTTYFEQVLNVSLKKQDLATHKEVKLLAYGRPHIVVEDNNGNFFYCGLEHGADVSGGTISTGAAFADASGYNLTFTAMEKLPANFLNATDEAGLITAGLVIN